MSSTYYVNNIINKSLLLFFFNYCILEDTKIQHTHTVVNSLIMVYVYLVYIFPMFFLSLVQIKINRILLIIIFRWTAQ